jgi:hypothetical protein
MGEEKPKVHCADRERGGAPCRAPSNFQQFRETISNGATGDLSTRFALMPELHLVQQFSHFSILNPHVKAPEIWL